MSNEFQRVQHFRELAATLGWQLVKHRKSYSVGKMPIRYSLRDDTGTLWFANLDEVEKRLSRYAP